MDSKLFTYPSLLKSLMSYYSNPMRGKVMLRPLVLMAALSITACGDGGTLNNLLLGLTWSNQYKGVQIDEMSAWGIVVADNGDTYTLGKEDKAAGNSLAVVLRYDKSGNELARQVYSSSDAVHTWPLRIVLDNNGDVIVAGFAPQTVDVNDDQRWFVTKLSGADLSIMWDVQWGVLDKETRAYTVAVGSSNDIYVAGISGGDFAAVKLSGADGSLIWQDIPQLAGTVGNQFWDSALVTDAQGGEWFYATQPADDEMSIRVYNTTNTNPEIGKSTLIAGVGGAFSNNKLLKHKDGYLVLAASSETPDQELRGTGTTRLRRIEVGDQGLASVSTILDFSIDFLFKDITTDAVGNLYVTGNRGTGNDLNVYIAKVDPENCPEIVCWDHTYSHAAFFQLEIKVLGIEFSDAFTRDQSRSIVVVDDRVIVTLYSETEDVVDGLTALTTLVGYATDDGERIFKIGVEKSDSRDSVVNPVTNNVQVSGVNVVTDGTNDQDIYLFTYSYRVQ